MYLGSAILKTIFDITYYYR